MGLDRVDTINIVDEAVTMPKLSQSSPTGGSGSFEQGINATATGRFGSFAQGSSATAVGSSGCFAQGQSTQARGNEGSFAQGYYATAVGSYGSFAQGHHATAVGGNGCFAQGGYRYGYAQARGSNGSFAQGYYATAVGNNGSFAQGHNAQARGANGCFAQGHTVTAVSNSSFAAGSATTANGVGAFAFGQGAKANAAAAGQFGAGTNSVANSWQVGTGVRFVAGGNSIVGNGTNETQIGATGVLSFNGTARINGLKLNHSAKTANYNLVAADDVITCGAGNQTFTVDLPTPGTVMIGHVFTIKNVGSGTITVDANVDGGTTIDGATTKALAQYESIMVISDGTVYWII